MNKIYILWAGNLFVSNSCKRHRVKVFLISM
ncbi:MAG: hypothetical protein KME59_07990 [Trichormus sp. ATA11-4-KO1]|nr:hypothetical protein [Trichormus sp. ATA11-4-KO1]